MENLIELEDCPVCRGNGIISHEGGWNVQVECAMCGSHTVYVEYENEEEKKTMINDGILFCSGMIAGEGLVGILLALLAVFGVSSAIDLSGFVPSGVSNIGGLVLFGIIILTVLKFSLWKKRR